MLVIRLYIMLIHLNARILQILLQNYFTSGAYRTNQTRLHEESTVSPASSDVCRPATDDAGSPWTGDTAVMDVV